MTLSVIIPAFNQPDVTRECLDAVRQHTLPQPGHIVSQDYEIVLVDNGSDPPIATSTHDTTIIRNDRNLGFPVAVNQGIRAAKGDVIAVLNNDVIVTPGWADQLLAALDGFSIVGPVTNYASGLQKVTVETYESRDELDAVAERWREENADDVQPVRWVIGFCMMFPKSLVDEIGYFDESLWPCCGEEIDFCFRARQRGNYIGIVRGCYVHHEGSVTFRALHADHPYEKIIERNNAHLTERLGPGWEYQEIDANMVPIGLCLNLGCGYRKLKGFVNIDNRPEVNPDILCDVTEGFPDADSSVDLVRADDFLEHVPIGKVVPLLDEIWRVLKPGGIFESLTPSTDGRGAFQDPTHVSFWNANSWLYYSDAEHRELYGIKAHFEIEALRDVETDPERRIVHTHVIARAVK